MVLEKPWTPEKIAASPSVHVWRTDGSEEWLRWTALEGAGTDEHLHGARFSMDEKKYVECTIPLADVSRIEVFDEAANRESSTWLTLGILGILALWAWALAALL